MRNQEQGAARLGLEAEHAAGAEPGWVRAAGRHPWESGQGSGAGFGRLEEPEDTLGAPVTVVGVGSPWTGATRRGKKKAAVERRVKCDRRVLAAPMGEPVFGVSNAD